MKCFKLLIQWTTSPKLAGLLIVTVILSIGLGAFSPYSTIYTSLWFIGLFVLLVLSTASCIVTRAVKARITPASSIPVHAGLLIGFSGILVSSLFGLHGGIALTEGESWTEAHHAYPLLREGRLFREKHGGFTIELVRFNAKTNASLLRITEGGRTVKEGSVSINNPLTYEGFHIYQGADHGFSPHLLIKDGDHREVFNAHLRLATMREDGREEYRDYIPLYDKGIRIEAAYDPEEQSLMVDLIEGGVSAYKGKTGLLQVNSSQGFEVSFPDIRRWTTFEISCDPGRYIVFLGFGLSLLFLTVQVVTRMAHGAR